MPTLSRQQIDQLIQSPEYEALPIQAALQSGYRTWWAQQGEMTRMAAKLALWEITSALELCFAIYQGVDLSIRLRFVMERDMDPHGKKMEMLVNGVLYEGRGTELPGALVAQLQPIDGLKALAFAHRRAHDALLPNRKLIADELHDALVSPLRSTRDVAEVKARRIPELSAYLEALVLARATPPAPASPKGLRL